MTETVLSAEAEEILDTTNFSLTALIGFILSLVGIFSFRYFQAAPFAILGVVLGTLSLWFAKRNRTGLFSCFLAVVAVAIGSTVVSAGLFTRRLTDDYDIASARKVCELYLDVLSKGDMDRVYFLGGFDPAVALQAEASETKQMLTKLKTDPTYVAIRNLKTPPKWDFVGVSGEYSSDSSHSYKLLYKNSSVSGGPTYELAARKNCKKYDTSKTTVNWFVDALGEYVRR
jgi:hypothetical protein